MGVVTYSCNTRTQNAEAGGLHQVQTTLGQRVSLVYKYTVPLAIQVPFLGCVPWFIAVKHIGPLYDFPFSHNSITFIFLSLSPADVPCVLVSSHKYMKAFVTSCWTLRSWMPHSHLSLTVFQIALASSSLASFLLQISMSSEVFVSRCSSS